MVPDLRGNYRDGRRLRAGRKGDGMGEIDELKSALALVGDRGGTLPLIQLTSHVERRVTHAQGREEQVAVLAREAEGGVGHGGGGGGGGGRGRLAMGGRKEEGRNVAKSPVGRRSKCHLP